MPISEMGKQGPEQQSNLAVFPQSVDGGAGTEPGSPDQSPSYDNVRTAGSGAWDSYSLILGVMKGSSDRRAQSPYQESTAFQKILLSLS